MISTLHVRPLAVGDIGVLTGVLARAYASEQNFELRLRSYLRMRRVATFVAECGGTPVGMVVGNDYGGTLAYVSQMAVDPPMQRQGIGRALMDELTAWLDSRGFAATELDATPAGAPLYRRYGFIRDGYTEVYASGGGTGALGSTRGFDPTDRDALFAADAQAFGADRSEVLDLLVQALPHAVVVAGAAGRLEGYAIAQPSSHLLGPVIASDARMAGELVDAARALLPAGFRMSIPSDNAAAASVLRARAFTPLRSLEHMVRGASPRGQRQRLFARVNLGQG